MDRGETNARPAFNSQSGDSRKVGAYADGGGLYVRITRPGYKLWTFRYQIAGRAREMTLGPVSDLGLAEARDLADAARRLARDGRDPIEVRRQSIAAHHAQQLKTLTFAEACERFLATDRVESFRNAVHRKQWRSTLAKAYPVLGDLPLQSIDSAILLKVLLPIMKATPETGSRLRGRIERVLEWARPLGLFSGPNPAAREALKDHLPAKRKVEHHRALAYSEMPAFMKELRLRNSLSARALEFTVLTAARTSEVLGMTWGELDFDAATWTVPATRMKAGKPHIVSLSERAVEILRNLQLANPALASDLPASGCIFGNGKPLSNQAMSEMLKGMGVNATVHGFRSSFRDWCGDRTAFDRETIELALAHQIKTEKAYRRQTAIAKRTRLMQQWCDFLSVPVGAKENVVSMRA